MAETLFTSSPNPLHPQSLKAGKMKEILEKQARKGKVKKFLDIAVKYGVVKKGWTATDYMHDAVSNYGWECTGITGLKGSAKSNLLMQRGFYIYQDWELVRAHMVTKRDQFLDLLGKAIEEKVVIPWMGVDDIATIFPSSLYFTDRKLHSELKATWETLRTTMSNFDWTATRKNKVASFITEDLTGDIICYNRRGDTLAFYDYQRWMWVRDWADPTEMYARLIAIEDIPFPLIPDSFKAEAILREGTYLVGGVEYKGEAFFRERAKLGGVPRPEFVKYWNQRLDLGSESFVRFKKVIEAAKRKQEKQDAYVPLSPEERSASARKSALARWQAQKSR